MGGGGKDGGERPGDWDAGLHTRKDCRADEWKKTDTHTYVQTFCTNFFQKRVPTFGIAHMRSWCDSTTSKWRAAVRPPRPAAESALDRHTAATRAARLRCVTAAGSGSVFARPLS